MKSSVFFNSILILSFVLSSFVGPTASAGSAWNAAAIIEGVEKWLDGLRVITVEPTATPIGREPTATPTLSFGVPPTGTPTPEPTASATPEPTATLEPTLIPTIVPSDTVTPTLTPTITPTPGPELVPGRLELDIDPWPAAAGDVVTTTWLISGTQIPLDGLELYLTVPAGITPIDTGGGTFDPTTNTLILPLSSGGGRLSWYISIDATPPYDFQVEVRRYGQVIFSISRTLPRRGPDIIPIEGSRADRWARN
jgi:hypothetical protein